MFYAVDIIKVSVRFCCNYELFIIGNFMSTVHQESFGYNSVIKLFLRNLFSVL